MKLLYITNGITGSGGLERVLSIKASMLAEEYHYDVSIMTLNEPLAPPFYEFSPKVKILPIQFTKSTALNYIVNYRKEIQKLVNQCKPDIICVCDDGLKGFLLPKLIKTRAKWIYERHASIYFNVNESYRSRLQTKLMQRLSNNFDRFVVLTPSNINEWHNNVIAISNPLSFDSQINDHISKSIIVVGSHSYNKGYDILLEIWKQIEDSYPEWELNIYGKIDDDQVFIKQSKLLNLKRVNFHQPVKDIQEKYKQSSIMLMTSRTEGFGMVLIEAMACGLPCISFDCPSGPRDIIQDGQDGFLIENGDKKSFQQKLEALMSNAELRKTMGARASKNVMRFSANNIVAQWDKLFRDLMP